MEYKERKRGEIDENRPLFADSEDEQVRFCGFVTHTNILVAELLSEKYENILGIEPFLQNIKYVFCS